MNYNNQAEQVNGITMPLIMGFTAATRIQEEQESPIIYDPISQTVFDMRVLGTKSLKVSSTKRGTQQPITDRKNEIDDSKTVH